MLFIIRSAVRIDTPLLIINLSYVLKQGMSIERSCPVTQA